MITRYLSGLLIVVMVLLTACGDDSPTDFDTTPPPVPEGIDGVSGDGMVELTWDAIDEEDMEGYNLYRSESSFFVAPDIESVNDSLISSTEFTDEDLQNGKTYYYRLTAVDGSGNESGASSELEITPFSNPPDRPKR